MVLCGHESYVQEVSGTSDPEHNMGEELLSPFLRTVLCFLNLHREKPHWMDIIRALTVVSVFLKM